MGRALCAEYFQQALIGPFIPHLFRMGLDRGMMGYTGLACAEAQEEKEKEAVLDGLL